MRDENNFDFLRLVFSSAVIFSHSFPLTGKEEIFTVLTNNQLGLGGLSVNVFFALSGYLIFISLVVIIIFFKILKSVLLRLLKT